MSSAVFLERNRRVDMTPLHSCAISLEGLWGGKVWRFDRLPSTNSWALDHSHELGHGDIVWALSQTDGRGRLGRTWWVLPGKCLTISLVVRKSSWMSLGPNLGQVAACAVCESLSEYGIQARLKWPNDVMVDDRKVSGILVEQDADNGLFVLGIGVNVNLTQAELESAGLDRPATSMREAARHEFDVIDVLRKLLGRLGERLIQSAECGLDPLWDMWARHDWLSDQSIRVVGQHEVVEGDYLGVDPEGRLRLRLRSGEEQAFWTGDVEQVRRLNG